VNNRKSKQSTDVEVYNKALKAIIDNNHERAFQILKDLIQKDSNNTEAYLLLGNLLRDRNINKAIRIHQSIIIRPGLSKQMKVQIHQALGLDYLEVGNTIRAEDEFKKIIELNSKNIWALTMLKNICIDNQSWDKALDLEKKLIKYQSKSKNEESMLNYFIAMDYKKKDNQKNYINFLERSVLSEHVYHESYLELAKVYQKKGDIDLAIKNLILFADKEPNASIKTFKDIENMLFEKNRFNEIEELYQGILSSMFHKYVFNRLIDIYLEKNDEDAARELIEKFAKQHEESYIIKLNRIKLDTDDIELRKSLSEVCYSVTLNEDNN
jgi:lipopolysaccharide biosynthesis regulator YciM